MREKGRRGRGVALAGLGGFILGAGTVLLIVRLYGGGVAPPPPGLPAPVPVFIRSPANAPALPPAVLPPPVSTEVEGIPSPSNLPAPVPPPAELPYDLARRNLLLPVQGARPEDLHDNFEEGRDSGARRHEALDVLAPRNTPILAVDDGQVVKIFLSKQGGLTLYQFDPTATYAYYYAHLERYAPGLHEGEPLRRGQILGYVGTSGNAPPDTPHLHFAIFQLGPEKHWWQGTPINPYPLLHR